MTDGLIEGHFELTREEVDAQAGTIGGHAFLAKPGTIEELISCIEKQV